MSILNCVIGPSIVLYFDLRDLAMMYFVSSTERSFIDVHCSNGQSNFRLFLKFHLKNASDILEFEELSTSGYQPFYQTRLTPLSLHDIQADSNITKYLNMSSYDALLTIGDFGLDNLHVLVEMLLGWCDSFPSFDKFEELMLHFIDSNCLLYASFVIPFLYRGRTSGDYRSIHYNNAWLRRENHPNESLLYLKKMLNDSDHSSEVVRLLHQNFSVNFDIFRMTIGVF